MLQLLFAHDNAVEGLTFSTLPEEYNKHRMFWQHLLWTLEKEFVGNLKKQVRILSLQKGFLLSLSVLHAFVNLIFTNEAASTGEWAGFCPASGTTSRTVSSALLVDFLLLGWCETQNMFLGQRMSLWVRFSAAIQTHGFQSECYGTVLLQKWWWGL